MVKPKKEAQEIATTNQLPAFSKEKINEETGEVSIVPEFKYVEGQPREYKSDAKNGAFLLNGKSLGEFLILQPIAWRFFEEDLFNLGLRNWAEVFFIDEKDCLSAILFHGFSVDALKELAAPLFYDDKSLSDVVLSVKWEHLQNNKVAGKPTYCVAAFEYEEADVERTRYLHEYAKTVKIYRRATLKAETFNDPKHNFYNPYEDQPDLIEG